MEPRIIIAASALAVAGLVLAALSATALGSAKAAAKWPSAERPALGITASRIGLVFGVLLCGAAAGLGTSVVRTPSLAAWVALIGGAVLLALAVTAWGGLMLASRLELSALINSSSPAGAEQHVVPAPRVAYGQPYPGMVPPTVVSPPPVSPAAVSMSSATESYADDVNTTTAQTLTPATRSAVESPASDVPAEEDRHDADVPQEALSGWVYTDEAEDWYLVISAGSGRRLMRLTDFALVPPGSAEGQLRLTGSVEMTVWPADAQPEGDAQPEEDSELSELDEVAEGAPVAEAADEQARAD